MRFTFLMLAWSAASPLHADCISGSTRPPLPAESTFEIKSKTALQNVLQGTMPAGWQNARPVPAIKSSPNYCTGEDRPIQLGYHVEYENGVKKREALSRITAKTAADPAEMQKITGEASHDTGVKITLAANNPNCGLNAPSVQKLDVPGVKLALRTVSNKVTTTLVCIGNWQITQDAKTSVQAKFDLPGKGARTTIQNLALTIQAEPDRADQLLRQINLSELKAMLGR